MYIVLIIYCQSKNCYVCRVRQQVGVHPILQIENRAFFLLVRKFLLLWKILKIRANSLYFTFKMFTRNIAFEFTFKYKKYCKYLTGGKCTANTKSCLLYLYSKLSLHKKKIKIINWMHIDAKILNYLIQLRL